MSDLDNPAALGHSKRERFLDIYILAGLHSRDGLHRMPMVRRTDTDGVDVLASQEIAKVTIISAYVASIGLIDMVPESLAPVFHGITDCDDACVLLGQKYLSVVCVDVTRTDQAQSDTVAWCDTAEYA